jgi:hypothetical protein
VHPELGKVWYTGWRGKSQSVDWQLPWQKIDNHLGWYCRTFNFTDRLLSE